jgi:hypothetical protein
MGSYSAIVAYLGITSTIFVGAVLWKVFRKAIVRRLQIEEYQRHVANHN